MRRRPVFPGASARGPAVLFVALLALAAGVAAGLTPSRAQSPTQFESMAVSVMPEYDQPSVFVSYRGDLNADVATPLDVRMRLPADATIDHACSLKPGDPDNEHICHTFTLEPDGQYSVLSYQAVTNVLYVEYHYGAVSGAGQRDLSFSLWPPYPVQDLDLFVQQPTQATGFVLNPAPGEVLGEGDFQHYSYKFQGLTPDAPVNVEIKYSRPTDEPSVQPGSAPAATETPAAEANGGVSRTLMLALALAGAALLGLVLYLALARRLGLRTLPFAPFAQRRPQPQPEAGVDVDGRLFCRHCGQAVRPAATFCSACGTPVRVPAGGSP